MTDAIESLNPMTPAPLRSGAVNTVRNARVATSLLFLVDGMTFGTWAALIPSFQQKFGLSPAHISVVLLGLIAGAMVSMPLAGKLIGRHGSRRVANPAGIGFATMLLLLAYAPSFGTLIGAAVLFGIWKGALDVSVNSQAITVENAAAQPIMGSFQGFWSLGGLSASALLSFLMRQGFSPTILMTGMSICLVLVAAWTAGRLLPDVKHTPNHMAAKKTARPYLLWFLGGLGFLALFSEGAMFDWSAVYIRSVGGFSVAQAPVGFAAFALCMASGRFFGDWFTATVGPVNVLRYSGAVLAAGIAIAVTMHHWLAILAGFALVGFGTANIVPVLFGVAGRLEGRGTGDSLAAVTTMGYLGFLAGPPLIGFLAAGVGLPMALSLVIVSGTVIATVGAAIVRKSTAK